MAALTKPTSTSQTKLWPGLLLTFGLATPAALLGNQFPVIGGAVFGILLGMLVQATGKVSPNLRPGITFSAKKLLQVAVILLGANLSLTEIVRTGAESLWVMLATLGICLLTAWLLGRAMRISGNLTTLIGVGTAICGASAIAAVSPVIEAEEQEVAYAISTIFLFNIAAVLLFPALGHLLGLDQSAFGLWAGTAINDTSSVVAAGYAYGEVAGAFATVVKLTRSTLIIPIALTLAWVRATQRRKAQAGQGSRVQISRIIPWFVFGFLAMALLNSINLLPPSVLQTASKTGRFLIVVALTGVGLSANFGQMRRTGFKPILLGLALWGTVAVSSLLIQLATGQL